jgi:hypothetical protein
MKRRLIIILSLLLAAASAPAQVPQVNAKLLKRTQERIKALYQYHDNRPAAPGDRGNPFRIGGEVVDPQASDQPGDNSVNTVGRDIELLRQAAATIKITGVVNIAKRMHIAVNKSTYREGGLIPVQLPGEMVFLRVVAITQKSVTLRLGEAEETLKF